MKLNPLKPTSNILHVLKDKGFNPEDIPKAIIIHELLGIIMLALTWSLCYYYPPSQSQLLKRPLASMIGRIPKALYSPLESNKFLSSPVGISYIESSCLRKLIRPLTLPGKLLLTLKLVQHLSSHKNINGIGGEKVSRLSAVQIVSRQSSVSLYDPNPPKNCYYF